MEFRLGFLFDGGESKQLMPLKMLFTVLYAAFSTQTFLPIYFDTAVDFSKFQIGVLLSLPCICAIISPPSWGAAADVLHNQRLIHIICLVTGSLLMFSIRFVETFPVMCVVLFLGNFQAQPAISLLDQFTMTYLQKVGGNYGKQRLYGAVGYGAGGYVAGVLAAGVGIAYCFNMILALSFLALFILVRYIPVVETNADSPHGGFLQSMGYIARKPDVVVLFVIVLLAGIMGALIDAFLFLFLFNLADNNAHIVGIVIAIETISELPLFFHAHTIIEKYGTPKCIFFALIAYGIRLTVYTYVENPWMVLPVEALHSLTLGLLWAALTNYIYQASPPGTQGTMIGLLAAVQKGLGGGFGTLIGGWVYGAYGARVMWGIGAFVIFPLTLLFTFAFTYFAHDYPANGEKNALEEEAFELMALKSPVGSAYGATTPTKASPVAMIA